MHSPDWANVSRETQDRLTAYVALLLKWNKAINLIGPATEEDIWQRHIWDSYQLISLLPPGPLADIGSGAGLPGLVIAIAEPERPVTLIERDQRKCAFLTQAALSLGLSHVTVVNRDIREIGDRFAVVTARALASLDALCELSHPLLLKDGICFFPKGRDFAREVEEATTRWAFESTQVPSKTHDSACIISISKLNPRREGVPTA